MAECNLTYQYSGAQVVGYCVDCPEVPAVAAVPERTIIDPRTGWNAGARSVVTQSGACYTQFSFATPIAGVVCGLSARFDGTDPSTVQFGIYGYTDGGSTKYAIVESGVAVVAGVVANLATAVFRVERSAGRVAYFLNNVRVHVSAKASFDPLFVVALMYRAEDGVL